MQKKLLSFIIIIFSIVLLVGCKPSNDNTNFFDGPLSKEELAIIDLEIEKSINYFWETTNHVETSKGYGLARDRYPGNTEIASIAAVGFALSSYVIGAEYKYLDYDEAKERVDKTLDTLLKLETVNGFYYHFVNIYNGNREWNSEVSIIDTGILLMGAISAGEYFGEDILNKVNQIYNRVNWPWYLNKTSNLFYMGYKPETGFSGAWDHISEQLMLYVLASGANLYSVPKNVYDTVMNIEKQNYKGTYTSSSDNNLSVTTPFYYSYNGSLFQHQFSHGFLDFRNINDPNEINWFLNATLATKANYAFSMDFQEHFKSYSKYSWGISASDGPLGYNAFGAKPAKNNLHNGTVAPYASLASINYVPKLSGKTALNMYKEIEGIWGDYGFKDAYNLGIFDETNMPNLAATTPWVASDYIGIDKGISLIMMANYKTNLIWDLVMQNDNIKSGLTILEFSKIN